MNRNEIDPKYTWDLSYIYKDNNEWYKDYKRLEKYKGKFTKYQGKLNDPDTLLQYFDASKQCDLLLTKLYMYVANNLNTDLSNKDYNEMMGQLVSLSSILEEEDSFVESELLSYSEDYINQLIKDKRFSNHKFYLKDLLRDKPHVLSEKEEKLLSGVGNFSGDSGDVFDSLTDVDFKFNDVKDEKGKKHTLTQATYALLMRSQDRVLRKNAYTTYFTKYKDFNNTIFTNYYSNLKADNFYSKVRHFKSRFESALYGENISPKLYAKLKEKVNASIPLVDKYYQLRKKALGLDILTNYDNAVSICGDFDKKYTYPEAQDIVKSALKPLGDDYVGLLEKAFEERWIDVYPTDNKLSGGYENCGYGLRPVIMLNFVGVVNDVFTLGHELGHAMHSYKADHTQPYETHDYTIFLAEIASTFNEILINKYLLQNAKTDKEKMYFLDKYIKLFIGTIFAQMEYSEFEEYAHNLVNKNMPISKEILNAYWSELEKKYFGVVAPDDLKQYFWSVIPHFYRSFYVYKYATGLISAVALSTMVLNGGQNELNRYFNMLSSGGSDYSTNILKKAGVDLTQDTPYDLAFSELKNAVDQLEKLIDKQ